MVLQPCLESSSSQAHQEPRTGNHNLPFLSQKGKFPAKGGAGVNSILRTCSWLYSQAHHKNHLAPDLSHKLVLSHCSHKSLLGQKLQTLKSLSYQVCNEG